MFSIIKKRHFTTIEINKKIIKLFLVKHPKLKEYINENERFYVRISKQIYSGLVHTIISENESNDKLIKKWNQLIDIVKKIVPKRINILSINILKKIVGEKKAKIIKQITQDIIDKKLNLNEINKKSESEIIASFSTYDLSILTIKIFMIFSCFKSNVLCNEDNDFIFGLQFYLKKEKIEEQDINNIKIEYEGEQTLFSLCMWKIRNERVQ